MKMTSLFLFLTVSAFAGSSLKTQLPKDHGLYFLAATSSEISQKIDKEARKERALEVCKHMGYKKLIKVTQKIMGHELLKVNDVQRGNLVVLNLKEYGTGFHAVIDKLECSK